MTRLASVKKIMASPCRKFAIKNLQTAQTAKDFKNRVCPLLAENPALQSDIDFRAEDVIGYYRPQRNNLYD